MPLLLGCLVLTTVSLSSSLPGSLFSDGPRHILNPPVFPRGWPDLFPRAEIQNHPFLSPFPRNPNLVNDTLSLIYTNFSPKFPEVFNETEIIADIYRSQKQAEDALLSRAPGIPIFTDKKTTRDKDTDNAETTVEVVYSAQDESPAKDDTKKETDKSEEHTYKERNVDGIFKNENEEIKTEDERRVSTEIAVEDEKDDINLQLQKPTEYSPQNRVNPTENDESQRDKNGSSDEVQEISTESLDEEEITSIRKMEDVSEKEVNERNSSNNGANDAIQKRVENKKQGAVEMSGMDNGMQVKENNGQKESREIFSVIENTTGTYEDEESEKHRAEMKNKEEAGTVPRKNHGEMGFDMRVKEENEGKKDLETPTVTIRIGEDEKEFKETQEKNEKQNKETNENLQTPTIEIGEDKIEFKGTEENTQEENESQKEDISGTNQEVAGDANENVDSRMEFSNEVKMETEAIDSTSEVGFQENDVARNEINSRGKNREDVVDKTQTLPETYPGELFNSDLDVNHNHNASNVLCSSDDTNCWSKSKSILMTTGILIGIIIGLLTVVGLTTGLSVYTFHHWKLRRRSRTRRSCSINNIERAFTPTPYTTRRSLYENEGMFHDNDSPVNTLEAITVENYRERAI